MLHAAIVFAVQFAYVFLLGFQSRCVRDGQYLGAMFNSLLIGCCGLYITAAIARAAILGAEWYVVAAFLVAGPCGIVVAMRLHDFMSDSGFRNRKTDR